MIKAEYIQRYLVKKSKPGTVYSVSGFGSKSLIIGSLSLDLAQMQSQKRNLLH